MTTLPNPVPRPEGELEALERAWATPKGWRILTVVNNSYVGLFYIGAAVLFLFLGGILALLMRTQLAVPENDFLDHDTYNQFFTTHGTAMMFLFAVPIVEAMAVFLLPAMLAARDLPFPRLSAYAIWAYVLGGLAFFASLFFDAAPDAGWFVYPPLSSYTFSPGIRIDFWLLGIGFIEISAIAGAIELIVGILKTRPPGMSLDRMPIYAWAMLVIAFMIVFGFPPVIVGTALLELERALHWPFFVTERGGDPLLWQHLFWMFGHPEVYIIFLPAAGMVSMMLPALVGRPLYGYRWVVAAMIGTGVLSFGLWAHHMFATGMSHLATGFFAAASMAVSIPSGIQVFSWIATLWGTRPKLTPPLLFILGFLVTFVIGGLTGVMVAAVPFDFQAHDSYFVVAHFHYVLIGGAVFPLFAAFYYWSPLVGRGLSQRLGRWVFWLMFGGFNLAFFPMHITGLLGMPRRVYTYPEEFGWSALNLASSVGAGILGRGFLLFLVDVVANLRFRRNVDPGDPWGAGTLEWLPTGNYATRSIPAVTSRYPLWDRPSLRQEVPAGAHFLPGAPTGGRETIVTSPVDARPQFLLQVAGPSWWTLLAAAGTAACFILLIFKLVTLAVICGVVAVAAVIVWVWQSDPGPDHPPVDIGGGITLPVYATGPVSHSWWATVVVMLVCGATFASLLFSYLFLWTAKPEEFVAERVPDLAWMWAAAALSGAGSGAVALSSRLLARGARPLSLLALLAGLPLLVGSIVLFFEAQWRTGLRPEDSGYAATAYAIIGWQAVLVATVLVMALYTAARALAGKVDPVRRATFDCTMLMWHYTAGQGLIALAVLHLFPLAVGAQ